jgi:hypothetical protein
MLLANALSATSQAAPQVSTSAMNIADERRLVLEEKRQKMEAWVMFSKAKMDGDVDTMLMLSELFSEFQKFCPTAQSIDL